MERTSTHTSSRGERELQERLDTRVRAEHFYRHQVLGHLNPEMQEFVCEQGMVFVATADGHGQCDCSFRAGPAGFVRVLDAGTLAYPEYRGNGVMASLGNIRETGQVSLLFMDFVRHVIGLHVNGRAELLIPEDFSQRAPQLLQDEHPGRKALLWVVVHVDEAYVHCSKHIPLFVQLPKQQHWGTDDHKRKGGDFFHAAASSSTEGEGRATT